MITLKSINIIATIKALSLLEFSYYLKIHLYVKEYIFQIKWRKSFAIFLIIGLFISCKENLKQDSKEIYTNSLINETSPYLLQHAHNPVNWKIWSDETLAKAKKENKLVILSVGYSSCHWCHVMESETFEDNGVAKIMNENFISIKVDREERPDIDQIYQTALQLIKGNGGWPLNAIILPNGKPVYLGTYHSKEEWIKVLLFFNKQYKKDSKKLEEYAHNLAEGIQENNTVQLSSDFEIFNENTLKESVEKWKQNWDLEWGGEKVTEKFIIPTKIEFLLDYAILTKDKSAMTHVKTTLDKIALGGIYDHVGGGFFRYSTDSQWKVPHFEKMLYDNGQLLSLYSKAYIIFKEPSYKKIVTETFTFLEREMKNSEGGYYAAIDAQSEGEEGKFYVWKEKELKSILDEDFRLFSEYYNIKPEQRWENESFILNKPLDDDAFIIQNSLSKNEFDAYRIKWKKLLLNYREQRIRPSIDDKILTSWNALLINGLVDAYKSFGQDQFLKSAESIFDFLIEKSFKKNQLIHSYKKNGRHIDGFLDDYVFMVNSALSLYSITLNNKYLNYAEDLNQIAFDQFADKESGLFKYNKRDELISKIIETNDGFWPSPNSVMAHNLFKLGHIKYDLNFIKKSKTMLSSMMPFAKEYAQNYSNWNSLLLHNAYPYFEIAVVGKNAHSIVKKLSKYPLPNTLLVGSIEESNLPLFDSRHVERETYIYVCQNSTCKLPVKTIEEALSLIENF